MNWNDKRVLITGAASGMGRAIADHFAALGTELVRADLGSVVWPGNDVNKVTVDVADEESVDEMVSAAVKRLGGLDVVVNCAGILGRVQPSHETLMSVFERINRVNLFGAFAVSKATIPILLQSDRGRLIHMASIAGKEGNPQMAAYSASKAGVIGLVKALGKEYARTRLTVNAIAPATIETPFLQGMTDERREVQKGLMPMGRFGEPSEAAALVEYIASDAASFTTGFAYDLSGGRADY